MVKSYQDKLKSPKWQKKRLEILNIHGFKCELCGDEENQIQVHHRFYLKGREPWEYDNDVFQALCESCHEKTHKKEKTIEVIPEKYKEILINLDLVSGVDLSSFKFFIKNICEDHETFKRVTYLLSFGFNNGCIDAALELLSDKNKIDNLENGLAMLQERIISIENNM